METIVLIVWAGKFIVCKHSAPVNEPERFTDGIEMLIMTTQQGPALTGFILGEVTGLPAKDGIIVLDRESEYYQHYFKMKAKIDLNVPSGALNKFSKRIQ